MARPTLTELANKYGTDKGTMAGLGLGYTTFYEPYFDPVRDEPVRLLELGVADPRFRGASLKMWEEYFSRAEIVGVDINPEAEKLATKRVRIAIADQGNGFTMAELACRYGPFDIVIDDGSHRLQDVVTSFMALWPWVRGGGVYFIEDMAPWVDAGLHGLLACAPGWRDTIKPWFTGKRDVWMCAIEKGVCAGGR